MEEVLSFLILLAIIAVTVFLLHARADENETIECQVDNKQKEDIPERYLNNYNYLRGKELFDSGDHKQAFDYLNKAIADDPNNGYAHGLIARIYYIHEDYGMALKAYDNALKWMPEGSASFLYRARAETFRAMGKDAEWLADCNKAIELNPGASDGYEARADYYYLHGMHEETIADMEVFIRIEPHNPYGYMVKGRSLMAMKKVEDALALYKYAGSLNPRYVPSFSFQTESLLALGYKIDAVNAEMTALELSMDDDQIDNKTLHMRDVLAHEASDVFILKLKAKIAEGEHLEYWMKHLAKVLSLAGKFSEAACWYEKLYHICGEIQLLYFATYCWRKAGNFKTAERLALKTLSEKPDYAECREELVSSLTDQGRIAEAIGELNKIIRQEPDIALLYRNRAYLSEFQGCKEDALKDYQVAVSLNEGLLDPLYRLARIQSEMNLAESNENLQKIVEKEDSFERDFYIVNVLLLLGKTEEARVCADNQFNRLAEYTTLDDRERIILELVEAYHKMDEPDKALNCVELLLSQGFRRFWYLLNSPALGVFCRDEKLIDLIENYRQKAELEWEECKTAISPEAENISSKVDTKEMKTASIPFTRENGICKVPCRVNDLPLHFVFDTGASDVSISSVEANFMLKNGYLNPSDLCGTEYFSTATGEISEGTKIRLKEVNFGGLKLRNVKASVIKNQTAPLLLGQTVLQRLGTIEIDNANNVLKVTSDTTA